MSDLLTAILAFSAAGSCIYVVNDLLDIEQDRRHAVKRQRPVASGLISARLASIIGLVAFGLFSFCVSRLPWQVAFTVGGYFLLNVLYCFWLKHIPIVDVTCISMGFVLRLAAGGLAAAVPLSHWIIITTFLLAFSVALAKRRDDIVLSDGQDLLLRPAQTGYNKQFIDVAKGISFAVTLVAYILYTVSPEVMARIGSSHVYVTALPVLLGIMRYLQLSIVKEATGSPVSLFFNDAFLMICSAVWLGLFFYLIYC